MQIQAGVPLVAELQEGVPTLRNVVGVGLVEYVRYNGELYSKSFQKYEPAIPTQDTRISKLTENTSGDFSNFLGASTYGVTQGTNATTGVTLNANAGIITTYAATIAENTEVEFVVTNSKVKSTSTIIVTMQDENTDANSHILVTTNTIANGSFKINLFNCGGPITWGGTPTTSATASKIHFLVLDSFISTFVFKLNSIIQVLRSASIISRDGALKEADNK
jgi:hypothetical protein